MWGWRRDVLLNLQSGPWRVPRLKPREAKRGGFPSCWDGAGIGLRKQQRADYSPQWLLISPDYTDLAQCCTLAWVLRQNPRVCSSVSIPGLPPPENLEICLSASISENIRLLSPLLFPSPLCFLPQQAKSPGLFHRTPISLNKDPPAAELTGRFLFYPVWASQKLGALAVGPL